MSLEDFITNMLNIKSENIEKLDTIVHSDESISIKIRLIPNKNTVCPLCSGKVSILGYSPRKLLHSTLVNRKCTIIYSQRRYYCNACEISFKENNPFINTKENLTYETKVNILKDLKFVNETYTSVAFRFNLSVTKVQRIFDKHVNISRKQLPKILSIDEHYFPESSYDSLYCCLLMNFEDGTLIDVLPDRKKDFLANYFTKIKTETLDYETGKSELDNVEYISIDLYESYRIIAQDYFPHAILCADPFHVLKHLTDDFRNVRLKCRRTTQDENLQYLLTKFKFVFDHNFNLDNEGRYNKRFKRVLNYREIRDLLFERFPYLKSAYLLKEKYMDFNDSESFQNAPEKLADLIKQFADSGIKEYDEFYGLLINWNKEIINSFNKIDNRRINNSYIESRNNQIERLMLNANGFKNFTRTRNRILYCLNKNDTFKI